MFRLAWVWCYLCGHLAVVYPAQSGKVGGLRTVEAMIESSMVTIREGDHELSGFLSNLSINHEVSWWEMGQKNSVDRTVSWSKWNFNSLDPCFSKGGRAGKAKCVQNEEFTLSKGMPYFFSIEGEMRVILWRRKASQPLKLLGKKPEREKHTYTHQSEITESLKTKGRSYLLFVIYYLNMSAHKESQFPSIIKSKRMIELINDNKIIPQCSLIHIKGDM